ncbi:D-amino acid dehydrogenase, partial [Pseudomonas sp. SIMBA_067]
WTLGCGSGRLLADLIARKNPQIRAEGLDISRYGNSREAPKHGQGAPVHQQ